MVKLCEYIKLHAMYCTGLEIETDDIEGKPEFKAG